MNQEQEVLAGGNNAPAKPYRVRVYLGEALGKEDGVEYIRTRWCHMLATERKQYESKQFSEKTVFFYRYTGHLVDGKDWTIASIDYFIGDTDAFFTSYPPPGLFCSRKIPGKIEEDPFYDAKQFEITPKRIRSKLFR